jgi:hypothetical protein
VLKQYENIVVQFLDGIQILIYMSVTYISISWRKSFNVYIKPNMFQTVCPITRDILSSSFTFLYHLFKQTNKNTRQSQVINQKFETCQAHCANYKEQFDILFNVHHHVSLYCNQLNTLSLSQTFYFTVILYIFWATSVHFQDALH